MTNQEKLYQIYELPSGNPWLQPMSRTEAVKKVLNRIYSTPIGRFNTIFDPIDWEKKVEGEIYVGTRISEDFPGDTDSYHFVIKPIS